MTIRLGRITTVVASSPEMAREILQKNDEAFSGRTIPDAVTGQAHYDLAVLWTSAGRQWRITRRVLNFSLINPQKLEALRGLRSKVVGEMVRHAKEVSRRGEPVAIDKLAFATALNQMSNTCFSVNVANLKSQDVKGFQKAVKTIMEIDGKFNIADYFPWLKALDPQGIRRKAKAAYGWLDALCDGYVDQRLRHRESNLPRYYGDLLDSLLDYSQENGSEFNITHIKILLVDLFIAGTETTANTIEWAMTELLCHPNIMAKLRQEIKEIVGVEGRVEETKILELPYLQAVVKETMRLHLLTPLLVPRKAETDVKVNGYMIPKDTQVLINARAIARDSNHWENPTCFMPERFFGSEVDYRGQHFSFLPFGSGRRMCPGIPLAQRVVSLIVASLVYQFDWKLPHGLTPDKLDMNEISGLSLQRLTPLHAIPMVREAETIINYAE